MLVPRLKSVCYLLFRGPKEEVFGSFFLDLRPDELQAGCELDGSRVAEAWKGQQGLSGPDFLNVGDVRELCESFCAEAKFDAMHVWDRHLRDFGGDGSKFPATQSLFEIAAAAYSTLLVPGRIRRFKGGEKGRNCRWCFTSTLATQGGSGVINNLPPSMNVTSGLWVVADSWGDLSLDEHHIRKGPKIVTSYPVKYT